VNAADWDNAAMYRFLISAVIPRPIAFVSSVNPVTGVVNLAPFSFFNVVCASPPIVMISCNALPNGRSKDTYNNIVSSGEFVINSVGAWQVEPMNWCSATFPPEASEMDIMQFPQLPSSKVKAPRVASSAWNLECTLDSYKWFGEEGQPGSSAAVFGKIVALHVADFAWIPDKQRVDEKKTQAVARLAGFNYVNVEAENLYAIPRPGSKEMADVLQRLMHSSPPSS
jgi:flavin reductase (DIM6/NTAB) family NADH-FMN oxidoreductase RutF